MTVNDIGGQGDPSGGGWEDADDITDEDPNGDPDDEVDDQDGGVDDEQDDDAEDHTDDQNGRPGKAASLRRRAQAAEAERDQLREQLDQLRGDVIADIARQARVDPRLLRAGGHEVDSFVGEDGRLDRAAIAAACAEVAREFGVRGIFPNPGQGQRGIAAQPGGVGDTINKALGRK